MGRLFLVTLEGDVCRCKYCQTHLYLRKDIMVENPPSVDYPAVRASKVVNISIGRERKHIMMNTRLVVIVDAFCVGCGIHLGHGYVKSISEIYAYRFE